MKQSINEQIAIYQKSIKENSLSETYKFLLNYMSQLQQEFSNKLSGKFSVKNVLNGYLDYTYFYFTNDLLKERKLKLGIIYNHKENYSELWLMGSVKEAQKNYWNKLKETEWNKEETMPQWYVISIELISNPNFEELNKITDLIIETIPRIYYKLEKEL